MNIQTTKIKDLTVDEFRKIIREIVLETLEAYIDIDDVDKNLTVREEVEQELLALQKRRKTNKTSIAEL